MAPVPTLLQAHVRDVACGERVRIVQPANLYGCTLGDDCFVGPFVEIQQGATIGARTKVQSHAFVCELVTIGADCFVGHGVMFTNDTFSDGGPARGRRERWKPTRIGDRVSIGSNATLPPVSVCGADYAVAYGLNSSGHILMMSGDMAGACHVLWLWDGQGSAPSNFQFVERVLDGQTPCTPAFSIRAGSSHLNDADHVGLVHRRERRPEH